MKKELLIHIGLPKTATSTLQRNVFNSLHKQNHINFLGRIGNKLQEEYLNYFEDILDSITESDMSDQEVDCLVHKLNNLLLPNKINVISEERISLITKNNKYFLNFLKILKPFKIKIIISLRNPQDFIFSHYVEQYRWKYKFSKKMDTYKKYIDFVEKNPSYVDYLRYENIVKAFSSISKDINIFLYEDFFSEKERFSQEFSLLLNTEANDFYNLFFKEEHNTRKKTKFGKFSESITMNQYFSKFLNNILEPLGIYDCLKKSNFLKRVNIVLLKMLSKITIKQPQFHERNAELDRKVNKIFHTKEYKSFIKKIRNLEQLKKYKYL